MHEICGQIAPTVSPTGARADLIEDLGAPLPAQVIGRLAGIPVEMRDRLRPYSDDLIGCPSPARSR